jgi:hypothetical protein
VIALQGGAATSTWDLDEMEQRMVNRVPMVDDFTPTHEILQFYGC